MTATITALRRRTRLWGFGVYAAVALLHVLTIVLGLEAAIYPTKLALMPVLALAAIWSTLPGQSLPVVRLLILALAFSWLGDGAAFFFPFFDDELPMMLLCFGIAHLLYIALFFRHARARRVPRWTLVYVLWWAGMLWVLWPHLGALTIAVAVYGIVLGGTAAVSARGGAITALGGAFFLASDTILSLRLFVPGALSEAVGGPWVMITYTIGQGLLAYGIVRLAARRP